MIEKMKWHPFDSERPDTGRRGKQARPSEEPQIDQLAADRRRGGEQRLHASERLRRDERAVKKR